MTVITNIKIMIIIITSTRKAWQNGIKKRVIINTYQSSDGQIDIACYGDVQA